MAHRLLDGAHRQVWLVSQQRPLLGVIAEHLHGRGELATGGVGAGHQDAERQHPQLAGVEAVAGVLDANEFGEQVIGQAAAAGAATMSSM